MAKRFQNRSRNVDIYISDLPSRTLKCLNTDSLHFSRVSRARGGWKLLVWTTTVTPASRAVNID